jgi:PAS domain S-box-containing protein
MSIPLRQRLSFKAARNAIIIVLLLSVVFSAVQVGFDLAQEKQRIETTVSQVVATVQRSAALAVYNYDIQMAGKIIDGLLAYPPIRSVAITDEFNSILARKLRRDSAAPHPLETLLFGDDLRYSPPLRHRPSGRIIGRMEIVVDIHPFAHRFIRGAGFMVLSDLVRNVILSAVLILGFYHVVTRPLLEAVRSLSAIRVDAPGADRVPAPRGHEADEMGLLITTVNALLDQSQQRLADQQAAEAKVRESEEKFRALVESTSDWIWEVAADGTINYSSPKVTELLGYDPDEILGRRAWDLMPDEDARWAAERFHRVAAANHPRPFSGVENRYLRRDGEIVMVETSGVPIFDSEGRLRGFRGINRDVTARKKLEDQLIQAQKMEAIGTLAGGIAHDFNNLLMGIQGNASLIRIRTPADHPHQGMLDSIESCVTTGAELSRQLLAVGRGGKHEVRSVTLNDVVTATTRMFGRTKKEITIETDLDPDLPTVQADRSQMEQVLLNLYVNAWQAMPDGGRIFVATRSEVLERPLARSGSAGPPTGLCVRLTVRDTGTGMDPATRERIFDPFFTTKERGRGTGLGLASVYGIIQNHRGGIDVISAPGAGTTFILHIPADRPGTVTEIESPEPPDAALLEPGHGTVLLVDDETVIRDVTARILETLGYNVITRDSGRAAVAIYRRRADEIRLVIVDIVMPDMRGGAVFDAIREIRPDARVLLCSGYSREMEALAILDRGANGFIQKPFTPEALARKVREILEADGPPHAPES